MWSGVVFLAFLAPVWSLECKLPETCYDIVGCFSNCPPWTSPTRPVPPPERPEDVCTEAIVYTPKQRNITITIYPKPSSQLESLFDPSLPTFFVTHGYISDGYNEAFSNFSKVLLNRKDCNIFIINWGKGAYVSTRLPIPNYYLKAVGNTRVAAAVANILVDRLLELGGDLDHFHFIGHSLGSHVMAYVCKKYKGKCGQLTGWDPASPTYTGEPKQVRFDKDDAKYTDAIHTNFYQFGTPQLLAHADFFINAGSVQPGCVANPPLPDPNNPDSTTNIILYYITCSHNSSYIYYTSAVSHPHCFLGRKTVDAALRGLANSATQGVAGEQLNQGQECTDEQCNPMGLESIDYPERQGPYFITTKVDYPYCLH